MELWLAACRFTHFLGLMLGFGATLFVEAFTPRVLRAGLRARLRPLALGGALSALVSGVLWLALEAPAMSGDPADLLSPEAWSAIAVDTAFGHVWLPRLGLLLALALVVATCWRARVALALWAAALASLALAGHAAMQTGWTGWAHRGGDALHLLCAGCWLGGLAGYLASLRLYAQESSRAAAVTAMIGFSNAGHFAVALLIATGVANIAMTTGAMPWPPGSPYRALLFVKIIIALTMVCIAIFNRYIIAPRLRSRPALLPLLARACWANLAAGAMAAALVSFLGLFDPA